MSATETENTSEPKAETKKAEPEPEVDKRSFRRKVWEHLQKNKLVNFPQPAYGRIPNFKGGEEAAAKLATLEEFKNAKTIEVNPDKAQEAARVVVLEEKKQLYVPVPRLKDGLLKHITVADDCTKSDIMSAVSRRGIEVNGETVNIDDLVKIDLLVLGSVAVSEDGYRIGKGKGYADLEFAVLLEMKAVSEETVIVTIVHDSQVIEGIPKDIFQSFDVPVDYILTPTRVIKVENKLPRPAGIIWSILSNRRLNLMPVLQSLRDIDTKNGVDVTLKGYDSDTRRFYKYKRFRQRRSQSEGKTSDSQVEEAKDENQRPKRYFRRPVIRRTKILVNSDGKNENGDVTPDGDQRKTAAPKNGRFKRPFRKNRPPIDFSLMVSNIEKTVRVRDLKNALNERGIKPNEITWRGYKGFCYLHYAKPNAKANQEEQPAPIVVDNVIEILQNLKICPESETSLSVKVLEPISRIETTNVTAV